MHQPVRNRYNESNERLFNRRSSNASQLPLGSLRQPHRTGTQFSRALFASTTTVRRRHRRYSRRGVAVYGGVNDGGIADQPGRRVAAESLAENQSISGNVQLV